MARPAKRRQPARDARDADALFEKVAAKLHGGDVTTAGRGFGAGALKVRGKIFAMVASKGQFVVKLPAARVAELAKAGIGRPFEPSRGRLMKEWLAVTDDAADPLALAKEALGFVEGAKVTSSRKKPTK